MQFAAPVAPDGDQSEFLARCARVELPRPAHHGIGQAGTILHQLGHGLRPLEARFEVSVTEIQGISKLPDRAFCAGKRGF